MMDSWPFGVEILSQLIQKKNVVWSADDLRYTELLPADRALTASNELNRSIIFYHGTEAEPHSKVCSSKNKVMEGIILTVNIQ
jgi:hypothetical protein